MDWLVDWWLILLLRFSCAVQFCVSIAFMRSVVQSSQSRRMTVPATGGNLPSSVTSGVTSGLISLISSLISHLTSDVIATI